MKTSKYFIVLASLIGLSACTKMGTTPDNTHGQSGFVKGQVFDTQGRPLAGATVVANSAIWQGNNVVGVSDASGNYKIGLPSGPTVGAYYVRGTVKMKFEGKTYELPLFTENDDTFMAKDGAVKT